ncbi:MAG: phosphate ABC transporter permease subunit PstC, partial [Mycobacterium sp.]|nr:phosphate ABC transporter permease subunit PstC [Mycobacterium sp.]
MTTVVPDTLGEQQDRPRTVAASPTAADRIFRGSTRLIGLLVLVLVGSVGVFLGYKLVPVLQHYGFRFFTESQFNPEQNVVGIAAAMVGTVEVAVIALIVAFPLALLSALYISEYSPLWLRSFLVSVIDLMAAIPSIVYGVWGVFLLMPRALFAARWISEFFGWIPIFKVQNADPRAATLSGYRFEQSAFIAGLVVAMMVIPLSCAIMRGVFAQAPVSEREGAYALGATRWGMIRTVVLPFGRGGIIGGTMLGLGRALGETVAVLLIISVAFDVKIRILESGTITISALIANRFSDATSLQLDALLAAGFVL